MALIATLVLGVQNARAGKATILLLDASNSMNSSLDGVRRIDAARRAISDTAPRYEAQLDLGLVVFGNRQRQSCRDIQTLAQPAGGNAAKIVAAARTIKAQGVSMLAQGLQRAAADAGHRQAPVSIIAIVDGAGVDACRLDTCATAATLKREARGLTAHVIAVAPKSAEVPLLECVASATGGTYVAVASSLQLRNALDLALRASASNAATPLAAGAAPTPKRKPRPPIRVASAPTPQGKPDPASPDPVFPASDQRGTAPDEPGAALGEVENTVSVFAPTRPAGSDIPPDTVQPPPAATPGSEKPNGNQIVIAPTAAADEPAAPPLAGQSPASAAKTSTTVLYKRSNSPGNQARGPDAAAANVQQSPAPAIENKNTATPSGAGKGLTIVPASQANPPSGAAAPAARTARIPAEAKGEGAVRLAALIVAGAKPVPEGIMWQIYSLAGDGGRGPLATRSSDPMPVLKLPAGPYLAEGRFGNAVKSAPFVVKAGEETKAELVLDVGGLQLVPAVAGAADANADITNTIYAAGDTGTPVVSNAAAGAVIYLSAGRYRIVSRYGNANSIAEDDIQIQHGKLTQAKINHRAAPVHFRLVAKPGGEPLPGVSWEITDQAGMLVKRSGEMAPTYVLVEGGYQITAGHSGKAFSKTITVEQGVAATVEILIQ